MVGLKLENISHRFGDKVVVDDLNLTIKKGQIVCLLGVLSQSFSQYDDCLLSRCARLISRIAEIKIQELFLRGKPSGYANDWPDGESRSYPMLDRAGRKLDLELPLL